MMQSSRSVERSDLRDSDELLRTRIAQAFAKSLHDQCLLHKRVFDMHKSDETGLKPDRKSRILHMSVLCRAIGLILLRCSDKELQSLHYAAMMQHLVSSVPKVLQLLITSKNNEILAHTTASNAVRILQRIAPLMDQVPPEFFESTALLLDERLPTNVRLDAALSLVCFLTHKSNQLYKLEQEHCNRLVSILCVSATTNSEAIEALATVVACSPYFGKLARRKCCILAAKQNLLHENHTTRRWAFQTLEFVLNSHESENGPVGIFSSNMDYIVEGLIEGATEESEINLWSDILEQLVRLVISDKLPIDKHQTAEILNLLLRLAKTKDNNFCQRSERAAICYLRAVAKCLDNADYLCNAVGFVSSPHATVRSQALAIVHDLLFWRPSMAETLFRQTDFSATMSTLIRHGTTKEQAAIMKTCKMLVSDRQNHCHFLECDDFIVSIVTYVTRATAKDLPTLVTTLDILLDLILAKDSSVDYFLSSPDLLPWMVSLANRTTCNQLKIRLIAAIQRLTLRLLDEKC